MASSALTDVLCENFDARRLMEMYMGEESCFLDDTFMQLVPAFVKIFSSGAIKGDTLIGIAIAPFLHLTLPGTEFFKEIIFASTNDKSNLELQKWLQNEPDAFNWNGAAKVICELEGKRNSWTEKQIELRQKIKQFLKCDVSKCNPFSPIMLPQADCMLLPHYIDVRISDKKSFCSVLKNISTLLKVGGHLVIMMGLDTTFYMVNNFKFPHVCMDEDDLRKSLTDTGYVIVEQHIVKRKVEQLFDLTDYSHLVVISARKEK